MRPSWCASCRSACAFSVREGEGGVGEVGEGGACLDFSRASIASDAIFFRFSIFPDSVFIVWGGGGNK